MEQDEHVFTEFKKFMSEALTRSPEEVVAYEEYIVRMTRPINEKNSYLEAVWKPWAEKAKYFGHSDFAALRSVDRPLLIRARNSRKYSFAIPNEQALEVLKQHAPIIEIGSGSGYWAFLLRQKGVDVLAVDNMSETFEKRWLSDIVVKDGTTFLKSNNGCANRTLLLCWPRDADNIIEAFQGDTIIWIGEIGGSTWYFQDDALEEWEMKQEVMIPTWPGVHDTMNVYKRKKYIKF